MKVVKTRHRITRRRLTAGFFGVGCAGVLPGPFPPDAAQAAGMPEGKGAMQLRDLNRALRATGKSVCVNAAAQLEALDTQASGFDLHLRQAQLGPDDAAGIATALKGLTGATGPAMRSFSVSYNPGIGEAGAIALIRSLHASVTEIGMVGCGLGDGSGEALLAWAREAPALRMLCVEGNDFSARMRGRLSDLRGVRPGLLVIA